MIHPPHTPKPAPDADSQGTETLAQTEVIIWKWIVRFVVVSLGIVAGLVLGVVFALFMGLIEITC